LVSIIGQTLLLDRYPFFLFCLFLFVVSFLLLTFRWDNIAQLSSSDEDLIENLKRTYFAQVCAFSAEVRSLISPSLLMKLINDLGLSGTELVRSFFSRSEFLLLFSFSLRFAN
jgi:hypothetical protein